MFFQIVSIRESRCHNKVLNIEYWTFFVNIIGVAFWITFSKLYYSWMTLFWEVWRRVTANYKSMLVIFDVSFTKINRPNHMLIITKGELQVFAWRNTIEYREGQFSLLGLKIFVTWKLFLTKHREMVLTTYVVTIVILWKRESESQLDSPHTPNCLFHIHIGSHWISPATPKFHVPA